MNLTQKLIKSHLVSGDMTPGEEIALRIDQTLSQDATGTLSYLQFEAIGVPRVRTQLSVSYVDHNMLQGGFSQCRRPRLSPGCGCEIRSLLLTTGQWHLPSGAP